MPSRSKAQARWLYTNSAKRALGAEKQREWIQADQSRGTKRLPERKGKRR